MAEPVARDADPRTASTAQPAPSGRRGARSLGVPARYAATHASYVTALELADLSAHTRRAYASQAASFLRWLESAEPDGHLTVAEPLTDARARDRVVRDYREHLVTVAKKATHTVNAHLTGVDAFYVHLGLGPAHIERMAVPRVAPRALDDKERRQVLLAAQRLSSVRDRTIVYTLCHSGVRSSELAALDVEDVAVTGRSGKIIVRVGGGPGSGQPRTIPVRSPLCRVLADYQVARHTLPGADSCPALFLNRYGGRLAPSGVDGVVAALGRAIGVADLTPFVLRHTFAVDLLRNGADLRLVSARLGHLTLHTTRIYVQSTAANARTQG